MSHQQQLLMKDIRVVKKQKLFFDDCRVVANFDRTDMTDFLIYVLPQHGFFRNVLVRWKLKFTDYPNSKPQPICNTKIFHPNISSAGSICYSMFGAHFSNSFRLMDYINGLIYLLAQPNHDSPLNGSCVEKNEGNYDKFVQDAARGNNIKGCTYDCCLFEYPVKDSHEFAKMLDSILFFLDQNKMTIVFEGKIKDLETKIKRLDVSGQRRSTYKKFLKPMTHLRSSFSKITSFKNMNNFEGFKSSNTNKKREECEKIFSDIEKAFNSQLAFLDFWSSCTESHPNNTPIMQAFRNLLSKVREANTLMFSLLNKNTSPSSSSNRAEIEETEGEASITTLDGAIEVVDNFVKKCKKVDEIKQKISVYEKRVNHSDINLMLKKECFKKVQFLILHDQLDEIIKIFDTHPAKADLLITHCFETLKNGETLFEHEKKFLSIINKFRKFSSDKIIIDGLVNPYLIPFQENLRCIFDDTHPKIGILSSNNQMEFNKTAMKIEEKMEAAEEKLEEFSTITKNLKLISGKIDRFWKKLNARFQNKRFVYSSNPSDLCFWEKDKIRVLECFEESFKPVRAANNRIVKSKIRKEELKGENIYLLYSTIDGFLEKCDMLFVLEMKIQGFLKNVHMYFRNDEEINEKFMRNEISKILGKTKNLYRDYLSIDCDASIFSKNKLEEEISVINKLRKKSQENVKLEVSFSKINTKIEGFKDRHLWVKKEIIPLFDSFRLETREILDGNHRNIENIEISEIEEKAVSVKNKCDDATAKIEKLMKDFEIQFKGISKQVQETNSKMNEFWDKCLQHFSKTSSVFKKFERSFLPTREICKKLMKLVDSKKKKKKKYDHEEEDEGEEETEEVETIRRKEIEGYCNEIMEFVEMCDVVLDLEMRNQRYLGRAKNLFQSDFPEIFDLFKKNEFGVLFSKSSQLFKDLKLNQSLKTTGIEENIKMIDVLRKRFEIVLNLENEWLKLVKGREKMTSEKFYMKCKGEDSEGIEEFQQVIRERCRKFFEELHVCSIRQENDGKFEENIENIEKLFVVGKQNIQKIGVLKNKVKNEEIEKIRKRKLMKRIKRLRRKRKGNKNDSDELSLLESMFEKE